MWPWVVLLGAPFFVAAVLCASLPRSRRSTQALIALGLVLGFGVFLWVYFAAPPSNPLYNAYSPCRPTYCGSYLGRWWSPQFAVLFAAVAYTCWLAGVWAGARARRGILARAPLA